MVYAFTCSSPPHVRTTVTALRVTAFYAVTILVPALVCGLPPPCHNTVLRLLRTRYCGSATVTRVHTHGLPFAFYCTIPCWLDTPLRRATRTYTHYTLVACGCGSTHYAYILVYVVGLYAFCHVYLLVYGLLRLVPDAPRYCCHVLWFWIPYRCCCCLVTLVTFLWIAHAAFLPVTTLFRSTTPLPSFCGSDHYLRVYAVYGIAYTFTAACHRTRWVLHAFCTPPLPLFCRITHDYTYLYGLRFTHTFCIVHLPVYTVTRFRFCVLRLRLRALRTVVVCHAHTRLRSFSSAGYAVLVCGSVCTHCTTVCCVSPGCWVTTTRFVTTRLPRVFRAVCVHVHTRVLRLLRVGLRFPLAALVGSRTHAVPRWLRVAVGFTHRTYIAGWVTILDAAHHVIRYRSTGWLRCTVTRLHCGWLFVTVGFVHVYAVIYALVILRRFGCTPVYVCARAALQFIYTVTFQFAHACIAAVWILRLHYPFTLRSGYAVLRYRLHYVGSALRFCVLHYLYGFAVTVAVTHTVTAFATLRVWLVCCAHRCVWFCRSLLRRWQLPFVAARLRSHSVLRCVAARLPPVYTYRSAHGPHAFTRIHTAFGCYSPLRSLRTRFVRFCPVAARLRFTHVAHARFTPPRPVLRFTLHYRVTPHTSLIATRLPGYTVHSGSGSPLPLRFGWLHTLLPRGSVCGLFADSAGYCGCWIPYATYHGLHAHCRIWITVAALPAAYTLRCCLVTCTYPRGSRLLDVAGYAFLPAALLRLLLYVWLLLYGCLPALRLRLRICRAVADTVRCSRVTAVALTFILPFGYGSHTTRLGSFVLPGYTVAFTLQFHTHVTAR